MNLLRRAFVSTLALLVLFPAFADIGLDFRASSGYVTDGAGRTYVLATDVYPVTRDSETLGWITGSEVISAGNDRNRDDMAPYAPRFSGIHFQGNSGTQSTFRLDVANEAKTICLALGDAGGSQAYQYAQLQDNTTPFATITDTNGTNLGEFTDASGVTRTSPSDWDTNGVCVSHTFTSGIFRIVIGAPTAQLGSSSIAHVSVATAGGGGSGLLLRRRRN